MRRHRIVPAALAALLLAAPGSLLLSSGSPAQPSKSQQLFRRTLLGDPRTTAGIKVLLRDRGGFVAPEIEFADVTGDGRSDALVLVESAGAGGVLGLYLFSTHGKATDSALRAVYRSQQLYRAAAVLSGETLILRTPRFAKGDDLCCPRRIVERVYSWSDAAKTLIRRSSRELPAGERSATTPTARA